MQKGFNLWLSICMDLYWVHVSINISLDRWHVGQICSLFHMVFCKSALRICSLFSHLRVNPFISNVALSRISEHFWQKMKKYWPRMYSLNGAVSLLFFRRVRSEWKQHERLRDPSDFSTSEYTCVSTVNKRKQKKHRRLQETKKVVDKVKRNQKVQYGERVQHNIFKQLNLIY